MKLMQLKNIDKSLLKPEGIIMIEQDMQSLWITLTFRQGIVEGNTITLYYNDKDLMLSDLQGIVDRSDK